MPLKDATFDISRNVFILTLRQILLDMTEVSDHSAENTAYTLDSYWAWLTRESDVSSITAVRNQEAVLEPRGVPQYIAHFVIRTSRYDASVAWYKNFFQADVVHSQEGITFLTWDDEHHRVAIYALPELADLRKDAAGIDHLAFTMADIGELLAAYKRLKATGVMPSLSINHGPTTSLYYADPDGVSIELQIENSTKPGAARAFFESQAFIDNPIGILFDPDDFVTRFESGEDVETLLTRPPGPPPVLNY